VNIEMQELLAEIERQFPKEFTICVQAVQIRKLQEQMAEAEQSGNETAE
jgi:hypothetical protein